MDAKEKKQRFGVTMAPTACTEVWRRNMPFDHNEKGTVTWSYIAVNYYTGMRTHINTYNGRVGVGYNALINTHRVKGWHSRDPQVIPAPSDWAVCADPVVALRDLARSLCLGKSNTYHRCQVVDCPAVVLASAPGSWPYEPLGEPPLALGDMVTPIRPYTV